jgi:hypothetical protein
VAVYARGHDAVAMRDDEILTGEDLGIERVRIGEPYE